MEPKCLTQVLPESDPKVQRFTPKGGGQAVREQEGMTGTKECKPGQDIREIPEGSFNLTPERALEGKR